VTIPYGEFIDPARLAGVCTREKFAAGDCPAAARLGRLRAWSPLLDRPLQGAVYLRESDGKYPQLAADLAGQIDLVVVGNLSTPRRRVHASFGSLPDLPLSRLKLVLEGGRRGLIVNSEDLCDGMRRAAATIAGHNGVRRERRVSPRIACAA
jgi:hypothetical protein